MFPLAHALRGTNVGSSTLLQLLLILWGGPVLAQEEQTVRLPRSSTHLVLLTYRLPHVVVLLLSENVLVQLEKILLLCLQVRIIIAAK